MYSVNLHRLNLFQSLIHRIVVFQPITIVLNLHRFVFQLLSLYHVYLTL